VILLLFYAPYIGSDNVIADIAVRFTFLLKISNTSIGLRFNTYITTFVSSKYLSTTKTLFALVLENLDHPYSHR